VNIVDHLQECVAILDAAIEAAARLPKEMLDFIATPPGGLFEPFRSVGCEESDPFPRDRYLHARQDLVVGILRCPRMDDQMDVVRHEHKCPQIEMMQAARIVDCFREPLTSAIGLEEGKLLVA